MSSRRKKSKKRQGMTSLQKKMFDVVKSGGVKGVSITYMYAHLYGAPLLSMTVRDMQIKLGPLISRVNAKLEAKRSIFRVRPGNIKQTYVIQRVE